MVSAVDGWLHRSSPAIGPRGGLYYGSTAKLPGHLFTTAWRHGKDVEGADATFYAVRQAGVPAARARD